MSDAPFAGEWVRAGRVEGIPADRGLEVVVAGRIVGLFRLGEQIVAIDGVCPHQGGPLARGCHEQGVVACPWHGWRFDLRTGRHDVNPRVEQPTFPVRVDSGDVYLQLPPGD